VAAAVLCADLCVCVLFVSTAARTNGGKRKRKRTTPALSPPKGRLNAVAVGALGVIAVLSMARGALSVTARRASWRASMVRDPPAHKPGARGGKEQGSFRQTKAKEKKGKSKWKNPQTVKKKTGGIRLVLAKEGTRGGQQDSSSRSSSRSTPWYREGTTCSGDHIYKLCLPSELEKRRKRTKKDQKKQRKSTKPNPSQETSQDKERAAREEKKSSDAGIIVACVVKCSQEVEPGSHG